MSDGIGRKKKRTKKITCPMASDAKKEELWKQIN